MAPDKGQITTSNLHHATIDYCSEDIITCYYIIIITYPERNTELQNVFLLYIAYRASDVDN